MPANRIAIGNGSCDILLAAGEALLEPGRRGRLRLAVVQRLPAPGRGVGRARRSRSRSTSATSTTSTRCCAEITVATRLVIVCNPNNPTSTALPLDEIAAFVDGVPRHVVRDPRRGLLRVQPARRPGRVASALLDRHPNLVLLRTFSKAYGLCGLRVGYGLCGSAEFRNAVDAVRQPFFCNVAAQAAAIAALGAQDEIATRVETNLAERMGLDAGLRRLGIEPAESQANFVWFDLPEDVDVEPDVVSGLPERKILVRAGHAARAPGRAARHGRHLRGQRALPGRARRTAVASAGTMAAAATPPAPMSYPTFAWRFTQALGRLSA